MRRKIFYLLLATIIVIYISTQQTNYINSLSICTLFLTSLLVYLKKKRKEEKNKNPNTNIIAAITHDLKTPAVAQIRAIELLLKGNLGEIKQISNYVIKSLCH